jgi:pyrimidine deaminase RibD-like protein
MPVALTDAELQWFMREALVESRNALPDCRPNPPVGCVIVEGNRVVARGFTGPPGTAHAEAAALKALGRVVRPQELALFVTLEPCAFVGRTPSCARAIVDSGIRTAIVGTIDPDPRNNGGGLEILSRAGIDVRLGVLESEVLGFLAPYLMSAPHPQER